MNISYDSYRVFYYAAKYKSFSQAAAALYNNQPNVTRIIRRLESELRCALFFRSPQGVRLTPEGEKLYAHIAVAFESIEAAEEEIFSDQSLQSGVVHIAASGLALRGCLLQVLAQYRSEYPHVRICLTNHTTPQGLAAVQNGLADFAVVSEGAAVPDSLVMQKVGEIQEIPICGSAFSELAQETVTLARLADYPIVSLAEGTSSHDFYYDLFLRHDLPFSPDVEVETIDQVLPAVRSNLGIGFVPREMLVAVPELTGVYPLALDEPISPRSIYLFQRKNQPLSIAARHLRQMLLDTFLRKA
ncbi:MAG: LysR family transcriptional regulator [Oscillospiraceae bacterium]